MHGFEQHVSLTLPPLSTLYFSVPAPRKKAGQTRCGQAGRPKDRRQEDGRQKARFQKSGRPQGGYLSPNRLQRRKEILFYRENENLRGETLWQKK